LSWKYFNRLHPAKSTPLVKTIFNFAINIGMSSVFLKANNPVAGCTAPLVFQYTPSIEYGHDVKYDTYNLVHTNYQPYAYARSEPPSINITAKFSAHTTAHFRQSEYAIRFLRTYTKMNYGRMDGAKGQPPRILRFFAYGNQVFDNVPTVLGKFNITFPDDVDYILGVYDNKGNLNTSFAGRDPGKATNMAEPPTTDPNTVVVTGQRITELPMYLPAIFQVSLTLHVQMNTYKTVTEFTLDDFSKGALAANGYI